MPNPDPYPQRPANWILAALPPDQYEAAAADLEPVALAENTVLYEVGVPLTHVYFPCTGFVSLMAPLKRDRWVEVAAAGRAGVVGICMMLGNDSANHRALALAEGDGFRMTAGAFREALVRVPALAALLLRYADAFMTEVIQAAVCKGHHTLRQRLCRWLLEARDRSDADELPYTQTLLAEVLTVRLASVSEAVGSLRDDGLIGTNAGHVSIRDRAGLEAASCRCYGLVADRLTRLRKEYRELGGVAETRVGRRRGKK